VDGWVSGCGCGWCWVFEGGGGLQACVMCEGMLLRSASLPDVFGVCLGSQKGRAGRQSQPCPALRVGLSMDCPKSKLVVILMGAFEIGV
jgi:hypothetical protein